MDILNVTIKTSSYDELDDILFNLPATPRFVWIAGKKGIGKTHSLRYVQRKTAKMNNFFSIYVDLKGSDTIIENIKNVASNCIIEHYDGKEFELVRTDNFLFLSRNIKNKQKNLNFILLLDGLDTNVDGFRELFRIQNQRFFEDLIGCGYYFFTSAPPDWEKELDRYFSGKIVLLQPFSLGEIKQVLKAINGTIEPRPDTCIHLLETTRGIPSDVVSKGRKLIDEIKNLENTHNKFVVEHLRDIDNVCNRFRIDGFRDRLISWLRLFPTTKDKELALKLANYIEYYDSDAIREELKEGYANILKSLVPSDEWSEIIVCEAGGAGKSGGYLLYRLRCVADLHEKQCCHLGELCDKINPKTKGIIFVDDFIGSGEQGVQLWNRVKDTIRSKKVYLLVICGVESGIQYVKENTAFQVICGNVLPEDKNILSASNNYFTEEERDRIVEICRHVDKKNPLGYGDSGLCIAFEHTTPNNTIAIIRADTSDFQGLFPRRGP